MKPFSSSVPATSTLRQTFVASIFIIMALIAAMDAFAKTPASELPSGLVFRIRTERVDSLLSAEEKSGFAPIWQNDSMCEFTLHTDYIRAQKSKNQLREKGFQNIEIVSYFNGNEISIDDAFTLLNNRNANEQHVAVNITEREMDSLLATVQVEKIYFAISIDMNDAKTVNRFFEICKKMDVRADQFGKRVVVFGEFPSYQAAEVFLEIFADQGITTTTISAWTNRGSAISMERALELTQPVLATH
jgi:hypothetical protein